MGFFGIFQLVLLKEFAKFATALPWCDVFKSQLIQNLFVMLVEKHSFQLHKWKWTIRGFICKTSTQMAIDLSKGQLISC